MATLALPSVQHRKEDLRDTRYIRSLNRDFTLPAGNRGKSGASVLVGFVGEH